MKILCTNCTGHSRTKHIHVPLCFTHLPQNILNWAVFLRGSHVTVCAMTVRELCEAGSGPFIKQARSAIYSRNFEHYLIICSTGVKIRLVVEEGHIQILL